MKTDILGLYKSIEDVRDLPTRRILYRQFIAKYFSEAYDALFYTDGTNQSKDN